MKKIALFICGVLFLFSCEKVIDLDLKEGKKELVVDASIDWEQGTDGNVQKIVLSQTSAYFKKEYPKISGAVITVKDSEKHVFAFKEEEQGTYVCRNFQARYNEAYTLEIAHEGKNYTSKDTLRSPVKIYNVEQTSEGGVLNEDKEIRIFFTTEDTQSTEYFLVAAHDKDNELPFYFVLDGDDFQDRKYFVVGSSDEWEAGDKLNFEIYHISETYFNYMSRLLAVADKYGGKPLTTPSARVQGNIINVADSKQNPLGAFRATSCLKRTFVVE